MSGTDQSVRVGSAAGAVAVGHPPQCAVCAHQLDDHDPISQRYCQATQANALSRNCICPKLG
jgi:hypothetical protein